MLHFIVPARVLTLRTDRCPFRSPVSMDATQPKATPAKRLPGPEKGRRTSPRDPAHRRWLAYAAALGSIDALGWRAVALCSALAA
jgi:hypothetical protein